MFLHRSYAPEIMDDLSIEDERIDEALNELKLINKYLGGIATSAAGLKRLVGQNHLSSHLNVLDVGSGASDVVIALQRKNKKIKITALDLSKRACEFIRINSDEVAVVCGDVHSLPFKYGHFDYVHTSLFLHHFKEEEIKNILNNLIFLSRTGLIINDLRRSILALAGIKLLTILFSKSKMVKNDAPLSVRRGFTKKELRDILDSLNCKYIIKRKWAFRWCVVIYKNSFNQNKP